MANSSLYVGVDAGSTFCKAIALTNNSSGSIVKVVSLVMGNPEKAANQCLEDLAKKTYQKVKILRACAVATGQNSDKITITVKESEITCLGLAGYTINPEINLVVDVGSFSMKALKLEENGKGKVKDFVMNNKCAGGAGILLELVAEGLEMKVEELEKKAFESKNPIAISSQCSIFAESEVISYKNDGANIADLVAGVCNSVAGRIYPMVKTLDRTPHNVAFAGGVALNKKVAKNLEERLELSLMPISMDPQYVSAYGAALIAKKREGD